MLYGGRGARFIATCAGLAYLALPLHRAHRSRLELKGWWRIPALIAVKDIAQIVGALQGAVDHVRGVPQPNPKAPSRGSQG